MTELTRFLGFDPIHTITEQATRTFILPALLVIALVIVLSIPLRRG